MTNSDASVGDDGDFDLQATSKLKAEPRHGRSGMFKRLVHGDDVAIISDEDRADLHAELDDFLDYVACKRPMLDDGEQHSFMVSGGCEGHDDDGHLLTSFKVQTTTEREL